MKRERFSIEQIVAVLKQAELGMPVADVIRQVGISEQTFYRWKKQYEPHRVLWRLQLLREWSHEQEAKQVFPGSPRARSAPGTRAA
ncbi:transposase IS3/IS911 family protein [Burkholderia diffusa]|uniref:Transposase IS3/IS911 family protein n=1 Tax=Burkholderia diffusa TaxID=488732 RepID=A0A6P2RII7_9BURK|nr:transposase IS3/IS911 family protein [Burkholderia diffusa]